MTNVRKIFSRLTKRREITVEEQVQQLREYRSHLLQQVNKTNHQIDELMVQRIREAGLGA